VLEVVLVKAESNLHPETSNSINDKKTGMILIILAFKTLFKKVPLFTTDQVIG